MARFVAALSLFVSSLAALAQAQNIPKCGPGSPCPADAPCCSQYGQCGVGAYCLGGCDPLFSHSLTSCVPAPVCKSTDYKLTSLDGTAPINRYLGDASDTNWVYSGTPVVYQDNSVLLTMAQDTVGTLMASTHYVWYGKISATLQTSQGAGVVTAFIMMSDVKDEIDFEFVGTDTEHAQSNFYSQGVTNYNNGAKLSVSATESTTHTYTIDWQPDTITWSIDGNVQRTLKRDDTWNSTSNRWDYPQTPSRVMLSLWPAGLPSNGQGTIEWAGGLVDWNSPYMQNGYYYARVTDVNVECYDPPQGANVQGSKSYVYTNVAGTNDTVQMTNNLVVLASLDATGEDPGEDPEASSKTTTAAAATKTSAGSAKSSTAAAQQVPGLVGAGGRGEDTTSLANGDGGQAQQTGSADSGSSSSGGGSGTFQQNMGSSAASKVALSGCSLAMVVAVGAMLVL